MPIVQPGQVNLQQFQPQDPGPNLGERLFSGAGLAVAGIIKAMQESKRLELEKQEFESKQAYFKTINTGNEIDNEKKRVELADGKRKIKAKELGLNAYTQWVGGGGRFEDAGKITARISDPDASQDFIGRIKDHFDTLNQAALARGNTADAGVKEATTEDVIKGRKADATKSQVDANVALETEQAQIEQPKANLVYTKALGAEANARVAAANAAPQGPDLRAVGAMTQLWKAGGISRGDAAKAVGIELPAGLNPDEKAPETGMGASDKRRNVVAATNAGAADLAINELQKRGVKLNTFAPLASGLKLSNVLLSDEQQQLQQANKMFGQMYALFVTGQAASDPLLREINMTMTGGGGEKEGVLQQQAIMRQVVLQAMKDSYGTGKPASQTLSEAAKNAEDMGVNLNAVKFLQKHSMDAFNAELKAEKDRAKSPIFAPLSAGNPLDYDAVMGGYDFSGQTR
jgi:hypothetical protein